MNTCPFHSSQKLRSDLPPLPERIAKLPVAKNGYPIPFFVQEIDGSREDFRIADAKKLVLCLKDSLCWVCGEKLGTFKAFVIGPMCVVNRISADPPAHLDCAMFSIKACPFLVRPNMVRREDERSSEATHKDQRGVMLARNPGVMALWVTKKFVIQMTKTGPLCRVGEPESLSFWREGRTATKEEIMHSVETGLPFLRDTCNGDPACLKALQEHIRYAAPLFDGVGFQKV